MTLSRLKATEGLFLFAGHFHSPPNAIYKSFERRPQPAMNRSVAIFAFFAFTAWVSGEGIPKGFIVMESSHSPDHRYGVTVPVFDLEHPENGPADLRNGLVELKTGRVLAKIQAEEGYDRLLNFRETLPARWSADSALLVWTVAGKWFPTALVALKIEKGEAKWQVDILKTAQNAILARTTKAAPRQYAATKKQNAGNGSAYPEGFTVDAAVLDPISFPLRVHATLTANPKQMESLINLDSHLDAVITPEGKFVVTDFQLEKKRE